MPTDVQTQVRDSLLEFLAGKGLRRTVQREAIIEAAFSTKEHYSAEELLVMARKIEKSVSRATVYRTLSLLVESGLLHELDLGSDTKVYDPNFVEHPTHNHTTTSSASTATRSSNLKTPTWNCWRTASRAGWVFPRRRRQ